MSKSLVPSYEKILAANFRFFLLDFQKLKNKNYQQPLKFITPQFSLHKNKKLKKTSLKLFLKFDAAN